MRLSPSPATALAGGALFFALGGSALAVSGAVKPQARCSNGTVRGIAAVVGETNKGMANVPDQFASTKGLFSRTFNCAGGATEVRRVSLGVFEVRFPGNAAATAVATAPGALATVDTAAGVFRVTLYVPGHVDRIDAGFTLVAV